MTYPILLLAVALAGKPVAIPSDAEPSTRLAASELTNYLYRITGKVSEVKVGGDRLSNRAPRKRRASRPCLR